MDQSGHESDEFLNQDLSAAIDNELNANDCNELIERLGQRPELQRAWERHHTINAILRGEHIAAKNHVPWEHIQQRFDAKRAPRSTAGVIVDFDSFKERYLVKVIGGMALAASVVLGVSLFIAVQNPVQSLQVPLASEGGQVSEPTSMFAASDDDQPTQSIVPESRLPISNPSEIYLVSDRELRQSPIPSSHPQRQSRAFPVDHPRPRNDLIHFVSD